MNDPRSITTLHAVPGTWLPPTQTWLHRQVRSLGPGFASHVVCDRIENADRFPTPNVHAVSTIEPPAAPRHPLARIIDRRLRRRLLRRVAQRHGARVLHSHFATEGWRNLGLAARLGLVHVVSFYGYDVNQLPTAHPRWCDRYRTLFEHVDAVLCEGEHMAGCLRRLGCPAATVRVHRLGVDLAALPFRPRRWNGRTRLRVLLAAAFREKKGLPLAIEALGRLARAVDLEVTVIGDATAAPASILEKSRILDAIDRGRLADRVTLLGFRAHDTLFAEAYRHHLFLSPSVTASDGDTEGGAPVTLIELAATGMPIVSTHHCDIPGVVRHGRTGFLAAEGDVDDLVHQLRAALAAVASWPAMLADGRRWIERRFDAVHQGARLGGLYADLLGARVEQRTGRRAA